MITVIIPILNAMPYLTEALASLEGQTFKDFEVCLWDNGSTDGSLKEARRWVPGRLKGRVVTGNALPLHECLARMVEESQTDFVARMDGDDVCFSERFQKQVEILSCDKALGIVGGQCPLVDQSGKSLGVSHPGPLEHDDILTLMMMRSALTHPALMFRRDAVLMAGNYRHPKPVEDLDLYLRMAETCKFRNLPDNVLNYRIHPASICQSDLDGQMRQAAELIAFYSKRIYGIDSMNFKRLRAHELNFSARVLLESARCRSEGNSSRFWKIIASPTFTFTGRCFIRSDDFSSKVIFKILDGIASVLRKNHAAYV